MNILENFDGILKNLSLLIRDIWQLLLFQTNFVDSSLIVIIWSLVICFVVLFFSYYLIKIIIDGILKFILNPITILFITFIFGLFIWTIIELNNDFETFEDESNNNFVLPKVEIEKIDLIEDSNSLKEDQAIIENLKKNEKIEKIIKKQKESIKALKNN